MAYLCLVENQIKQNNPKKQKRKNKLKKIAQELLNKKRKFIKA